ncbi:phosphoribosylformylglycinamidine cyclo-ligase [Alicyclobacillus cellulosilyticus]|uniref:Phosphoribosylformylglycinamidine cyclo-ligase n=1 Tax=Alicyclobacillus cellulosilyticus TaxID=1003997 RepID=A0A917KG04_9BACL|nr:phosphoribosylformylglycinamidine cyclo-ligase [Alicyclobacillus cellulosilyticus]GGJ09834.1 phosphoribosylformylglycinamidine cyclo-ligase [Alicyclobacillus cellulosilyticus]
MSGAKRYKAAGVDIDAGNAAAKRYAEIARRTARPEVLAGIGGFAGGFALDLRKYPEPVLVAGTDGVGTKLKIAFALGRHDTIGIDCVAMCVNDILVTGAEPLFFLDYLAVGRLDVETAAAVVRGVAQGCAEAGCALIGGETAEMPGMYAPGEYDVAGFAVGVVNRSDMVDGRDIRPGDVVLGLASSGVHANGYSLVRELVASSGLTWDDVPPGWDEPLGEVLLRPTRIYVRTVLGLRAAGVPVKGMAHITGGGLVDNVPRCLPPGVAAKISLRAWPLPPVFRWLVAESGMSLPEAARVWNLGIGYVLVVDPAAAAAAEARLRAAGETVYRVGEIVPAEPGAAPCVVIEGADG